MISEKGEMSVSDKRDHRDLTRRDALGAVGVCFAMFTQKALAAQRGGSGEAELGAGFTKDSDRSGLTSYAGIHAGKGRGRIKMFPFGGAAAPANFLIYELPPGTSEGTHSHFLDNRNQQGSYDEYYYIISGRGQMEINGEIVPVSKGDHVHTPLEVAHGIENTDASEDLRVFLTFIKRGNESDYLSEKKA